MKTKTLFSRDFTLMVLGQIISLFGNSILRFALSLYVLDLTGSAAIFGSILAVSMIPTVILSPMGGVLADRLPKQKIMVLLDFTTAGLIFLFDFLFARSGNLAAITVLMVLLALIQAFYQPSVQASIPVLAAEEHLMQANGVVIQVQAMASLLGPIIGGFLYGYLGLFPILITSAVCFFFSAVMEIFIRIPFIRRESGSSVLASVTGDIREAFHFISRENPRLMKLLIIIAGLNMFLSAMLIIGLPYLIKIHLGLSAELYGFAEAAMGLGTILGGLLSGVFGRHIKFSKAYLFLVGATLLMAPIIPALALGAPALVTYACIIAGVLLAMTLSALFNIIVQTFLQKQTPAHLIGKVGAFVSTICICVLPLGQALYGGLFQAFHSLPWIVLLLGCIISMLLSLATKKAFQDIEVN